MISCKNLDGGFKCTPGGESHAGQSMICMYDIVFTKFCFWIFLSKLCIIFFVVWFTFVIYYCNSENSPMFPGYRVISCIYGEASFILYVKHPHSILGSSFQLTISLIIVHLNCLSDKFTPWRWLCLYFACMSLQT